jgi:hypothetical protein
MFARYRTDEQRMMSFAGAGIKRFAQSPTLIRKFVLKAKPYLRSFKAWISARRRISGSI